MQKIAPGTAPLGTSRRTMVSLARALRRPWTWVALAYLGLALTIALQAPTLSRFFASLLWTTLALVFVGWTVIVWRIVHVSTFGRNESP